MNGRATFEVQALQDKNWVVMEFAADEGKARAFADNLLQAGNHAAVRVVRDYLRADGLHDEKVIEEKQASQKPAGDIGLSPITEAPPCADLDAFYRLPARLTMGRLLRKYLDEVVVTPTEILHDHKELKRFGDKGNLLFSAIDRVSTLQAAAAGEESKPRREFLSKSWDELGLRARAEAEKKHKIPKAMADIIATAGDPATPSGRHAGLTLMTLRLLETRSWIGKLDQLLAWAGEEGAAPFLPLIDSIIADVVVSAQLIQDLLGYQANLAQALIHICDLSLGKGEAAKFAPATFTGLNALFATGGLPEASAVLMTRVVRELAGTNPLSRSEPKLEYEMFVAMLTRLIGPHGASGGPDMAQAFLVRAARLNSVDALGAMDMLMSALPDTCSRVQCLLALGRSGMAESLGEHLGALLDRKVREAIHIDRWIGVRVAPRDRMVALTAVNRDLKAAGHAEFALLVDEVLTRYLQDEEVIEKIDKPDDPLALRAIRLIKFCGSGVLIEGKSLNLARSRVIEHLKQPQFEEKFLASVADPTQAEKHLREFHRLLVETGFR